MLISQTALTVFVTTKALFKSQAFTPHALTPPPCTASVPNYTHFASLMVHPVTGKTISSYKWLMNNPATAKFWQVAFGKDFGRMAQGNEKTCQKGRKSMRKSKISLTLKSLWVFGHKRKIPIRSELQTVATSSNIKETYRHE